MTVLQTEGKLRSGAPERIGDQNGSPQRNTQSMLIEGKFRSGAPERIGDQNGSPPRNTQSMLTVLQTEDVLFLTVWGQTGRKKICKSELLNRISVQRRAKLRYSN